MYYDYFPRTAYLNTVLLHCAFELAMFCIFWNGIAAAFARASVHVNYLSACNDGCLRGLSFIIIRQSRRGAAAMQFWTIGLG